MAKGALAAVPTVSEDRPVFDPEGTAFRFGTQMLSARELPIARLKKFKDVFLRTFSTINTVLRDSTPSEEDDDGTPMEERVMATLFGVLEQELPQLFAIALPGLDPDAFEDEEGGPTFPQLRHAVDAVIKANQLEVLYKAVPFVLQQSQEAERQKRYRMIQADLARAEAASAKMNSSAS